MKSVHFIKQSSQNINKIFSLLQKQWPQAKCELIAHSPFQFLLAVMLSAQTTDKSVNKALTPLFEKYPKFSAQDLVKMGVEAFYHVIKNIGLARTKAKNAYHTAQILIEKFNEQVPHTREELESLPGVGRKTANVVLHQLINLPVIAVDTHVARVSQRIGLVSPTENRLKIEQMLMETIPKKYLHAAHHILIFHGRYICTARAPKCSICPINSLCKKYGVK